MIDGKLSLELEIDEGLNGGALHLNNHVDGCNEQQRIDHHIAAAQLRNDAFLPGVGQEMGEIAKGHEGQHILIARTHLLPQLGMEVEEDLPQHGPAGSEGLLPKENPREANEMEGEHDGNPLAHAMGLKAAPMMQHLLTEEFMCGECDAMCPAPCHKVETCAMPQTAQEHRDDKIDILSQLAFAVAAQRDINVVANPSGERDVPAPPKVGDAHRAIRCVEVDGEMETQ